MSLSSSRHQLDSVSNLQSGMILRLGRRGPAFKPRFGPYIFFYSFIPSTRLSSSFGFAMFFSASCDVSTE
ncbi:hypothetical protein BJX68DRAFT_245435 [Aspergillus pseudodeflectus]|uniref:Uncharacterized protein n=1 Tax=Aspergillus pseudodeflectus TaxID=176178 RepID=A0ABR4JN44_9EURO